MSSDSAAAPDPSNREARTDGRLVIIGTPIGNLSDLSGRAAQAVQRCDAIVCEDSRRTGKLLAHIGSDGSGRATLLVANDHTEETKISEVIDRVQGGEMVGLVTDAGMPTISDPGQQIVAAVASAGLSIEVIPGPTAVSAAVAISGMSAARFVFEGFLPRKGAERKRRLAQLADEERTIVLYEAPHRIQRTLADLAVAVGPQRAIAIARELTKLYEQVVRGSLEDVIAHFDVTEPRGEFVIVLEGSVNSAGPVSDDDLRAELDDLAEAGLSTRDAVAEVVAKTGESKRRVYTLANEAKQGESSASVDSDG